MRATRLPNGIRVLSEELPDLPSVTVGIWVENGSRYEPQRAGGHLALPRAPVLQGDGAAHGRADRRGDRRRRRRRSTRSPARSTPATTRRCSREHLPLALDVLGDIFLHSRFAEEEIDRERSVDPAGDLAGRGHAGRLRPRSLQPGVLAGTSAVASGRGHARRRCGPLQRERLPALPRGALPARPRHHRGGRATSGTTTWSTVGDAHVRRHSRARSAADRRHSRRRRTRASRCTRRPSSRCTSASASPGIAAGRSGSLRGARPQPALGGGMSSRLFQEVRERRGKAYSVYSFLSSLPRRRLPRRLRRHQPGVGRAR